jgi:hypothetical protein
VHACVSVLGLDALHTPLPHVEAVTVRVCVPVASQKSLKPPQLPHAPALVPQLVPLAAYPSPGQLLLLPVQYSATSQVPAEARHAVVLGCVLSAGHVAVLPVQYSATSHTPAEARHSVVAGLKLQLFVDTLGLHCWQSPAGLLAPAA